MPRYRCRNTEVLICTSEHDFMTPGSSHSATSPEIDSYSTSDSTSGFAVNSSISHRSPLYDPTLPYKATRLKEEFFKGYEGLEFLGYDIPFYLIQAGKKDLSNGEVSTEPQIDTGDPSYQRRKASLGSLQTLGSQISISGISFVESTGLSSSNISSLPTTSSAIFLSSHAYASKPKVASSEIGDEKLASEMTPESSKNTGYNLVTPGRSSASEPAPKFIKVMVKLSDKSFISPLSGVSGDRYDICINIFYNGELSISKVINYNAWVISGKQNRFNFCGRRIDTCREVPWMLAADIQNADSYKNSPGKPSAALSPLERWSRLKDMLLIEADEWGRDERGYRFPTGEYLELLSRKAMPSDLDTASSSAGSKFGVIDVVITHGLLSRIDNANLISSPRRSLPKGQFQRAGVIFSTQYRSKSATLSRGALADLPMISPHPSSLNYLDSPGQRLDLNGNSRSLSTLETFHTATPISNPYDQMSSSTLEATTASATVTSILQATSMSASVPSALAPASTTRPPHPHRPKLIPQKRYRGNEPLLPPAAPAKRQKTVNPEDLPYDLNASASMSTRSRRSASIPFAQTQPTQPEGTIAKKRGVEQEKGAFFNAESSGIRTTLTPSTPKKNQVIGPKTPASRGSVTKKARTSNYNPKYSNRPQNLRRKNSAGEWYFPTCRKNSAGDWETPTNYRKQAKGVKRSNGQTDESAPEGAKKIFQPVFTALADNANRDMAIRPMMVNRPSLAKNHFTIKENVAKIGMVGKADKFAFTYGIANPPLKNGLQDIGSNRDSKVLAAPTAKSEATIKKFHHRETTKKIVTDVENERQKTLRIRFFKAKNISSSEDLGAGGGARTWQAQRSVSPKYIPASSSAKNPSSSCPLSGEAMPKLSNCATSFQGDGGSNLGLELDLKSITRAYRKPHTGIKDDLGIANESVINTLRDSSVGTSQQAQMADTKILRPRFMIPNHNSKVLKLVKRQGGTTEAGAKQDRVQVGFDQAAPHNSLNQNLRKDTGHPLEPVVTSDQSAHEVDGDSRSIIRQGRGLRCSLTTQLINGGCTQLILGPATITTEPAQVSTSVVRIDKSNLAPKQLPVIEANSKLPPRPRTVGSIELKALLESHEYGSALKPSLDTSSGILHTQLMTRATRKAISYDGKNATAPNAAVSKTQVPTKKPSVRLAVASKNASRKHSFSSKTNKKPEIVALAKNDMKDTDEALSKGRDIQNDGKVQQGGTTNNTERLPVLRSNSPKPDKTPTVLNDLSLLSAGEVARTRKPPTQKIKLLVSRRQKDIKIPADVVVETGERVVEFAAKAEGSIVQTGLLIKNSTFNGHKSKEAVPQASASSAVKYKETVEEVDKAPKQEDEVRKEVAKAAGGLESDVTLMQTPRKAQEPATNHVTKSLSNSKVVEQLSTKLQGIREQKTYTPSPLTSSTSPWKPSCLCKDSMLTYAESEICDCLEKNPMTGQVCRKTEEQEGGYFRAFGVLMGVRYVVVGSEVATTMVAREGRLCYLPVYV